MALKSVVDSLDGIPADVAKEYKKGDDNKYHLDIEGAEDTGALKRAKDHEKTERQRAETALKEARDQLLALTEERDGMLRGAVPKGDVDKLENSYKEKLIKREAELTAQINGLNGHINTMLVDNVAIGMASKISTSPDLILPHIKGRLRTEFVDGKPVTRVLAQDGTISAATLEDLSNEMVANKAFAPIIIGSKASGSGAEGGHGSGAPGKLDYAKASPKEIAAHIKTAGLVKE